MRRMTNDRPYRSDGGDDHATVVALISGNLDYSNQENGTAHWSWSNGSFACTLLLQRSVPYIIMASRSPRLSSGQRPSAVVEPIGDPVRLLSFCASLEVTPGSRLRRIRMVAPPRGTPSMRATQITPGRGHNHAHSCWLRDDLRA